MGYACKLGGSSSSSLDIPHPYYFLGSSPGSTYGLYPYCYEMDTPTLPSLTTLGVFWFPGVNYKGFNNIYFRTNTSVSDAGACAYVAIMNSIPSTLAQLQADPTYRRYDLSRGSIDSTYSIPNSVKDGSEYYLIIFTNRVYWYNGGTYYAYRGVGLLYCYMD